MGFTVSKQTGTWLLIFAIVGAVLIGIQFIRVNAPEPTRDVAEQRVYTKSGPVFSDNIEVAANSFYAHKIDLNRRMKLAGSFHTEGYKGTVAMFVLREADLENWKLDREVAPVVKTNPVPGGKLSPVLEPGVYYLVIDNRKGDQARVVTADFVLE